MTNRWVLVIPALAGMVAVGLAQRTPVPRDAATVKDALMAADRAFAKAAAEKGIDGWMSYMAADAVRISPLGGTATVGTKAVRELDAKLFADPKQKLVWEPTDGGAFADGNTGFTTGKAKIVATGADGKDEVSWTGAYVTIWRKGADGSWKVILDTGASDPPKK